MVKCSLIFAIFSAAFLLMTNQSPAVAQSGAMLVVQGQDQLGKFCRQFGLRDNEPFGNVQSNLWADPTYQKARSMLLRNSKGRRGRLFDAAENIYEQISEIEVDETRLDVVSQDSLPCPTGTFRNLRCVIGGCDFVLGVNCLARDNSALKSKKSELANQLVNTLTKALSLAAKENPKLREDAKTIKSALTALPDTLSEKLRNQDGIVYTCDVVS
jgi:hypothetical protein